MFMSPSHAMIYVSLLRGALIISHAFTFNIGDRQGRAVSRVKLDTKQSSIDHTIYYPIYFAGSKLPYFLLSLDR